MPRRYNEKMQRMQRGLEGVVDELFTYACPKFVAAVPPRLDNLTVNSNQVRLASGTSLSASASILARLVFLAVRKVLAPSLINQCLYQCLCISICDTRALMHHSVASLKGIAKFHQICYAI